MYIQISHHLIHALTAPVTTSSKPTSQLNRAALGGLGLKGLPLKPEILKTTKAGSMDDSVETKRKLETLDLPEVDMTMTDSQANIGDLEGDDEEEEADKSLPKAADAMDEDEDDADPLDAFMSGVKEEVKKVNLEDMKKMSANGSSRVRLDDRMAEDAVGDIAEGAELDEIDATELNPEDILALAAKKAKKKDLATVDHNRISYEPFRKEFYNPPPDIAAMTDEEADLLRLELDGIKIRGVDCPRPVTKWSHFGLPAVW